MPTSKARRVVRWALAALAAAGIAVGGSIAVYRHVYRMMLWDVDGRNNAEEIRLFGDFERRARAHIAAARQTLESGPIDKATVDRLFHDLNLPQVAGNSREVARWRVAPHSAERTSVALKWAETVADEAAFHKKLREIWDREYRRGVSPHHITNDEVEPFAMPEGRTEDDPSWR